MNTETPKGKRFEAFKAPDSKFVKATYTGEKTSEIRAALALVDFRDNLRRFLEKTGVDFDSEQNGTDEPVDVLNEVRDLLGIDKKAGQMPRHLEPKRIVPASERAERIIGALLESEGIKIEVVGMLLAGKHSHDIRDYLEKRVHDVFPEEGFRQLGRAVDNRFSYRNKVIEFIKLNRPETTEEELQNIYSKRDGYEA